MTEMQKYDIWNMLGDHYPDIAELMSMNDMYVDIIIQAFAELMSGNDGATLVDKTNTLWYAICNIKLNVFTKKQVFALFDVTGMMISHIYCTNNVESLRYIFFKDIDEAIDFQSKLVTLRTQCKCIIKKMSWIR